MRRLGALLATGFLAGATPPAELGASAQGPELEPLCGDPADCGAKRPPRSASQPAKPLVETGGWGFSYGPIPLRHPGNFPNDDLMASWMQGQWSWQGRNDLGVMAGMGANTVRLYGNDPRESADDFFGQANGWGLKVIVGISDWPYIQAPDKCVGGENDCYESLQDHYGLLLKSGGVLDPSVGPRYHPALDTLIVINEPDLKIRYGGNVDKNYMKVVLSAFDGILAAEAAAGLDYTDKDSIKLTATWSYAVCSGCPDIRRLKDIGCCIPCTGDECTALGDAGKLPSEGGMRCTDPRKPNHEDDCPGLPMVVDLHAAVQRPESVGYTSRTPRWKEAFTNRWVHSLNAFVGAKVFDQQFLSKYSRLTEVLEVETMPPVFLGEFGDPHQAKDSSALREDLRQMVELVKSPDNKLFAFNFFEFQAAYWKPCSKEEEEAWEQWYTLHWGEPQNAPPLPSGCAERNFGVFALGDITVGKTGKVGLEGNEAFSIPCIKPIFNGKPQAIAQAFGGSAPNTSICERGWEGRPAEHCVASRGADLSALGKAVHWVCSELSQKGIDCQRGKPAACRDSEYSEADWFFSLFYEVSKAPGGDSGHLCDFGGAGVLTALPPQPECVQVRGAPTPGPSPSPAPTTPPAPPRRTPHTYEVLFVVGAVLCVAAGGIGAALLYNTPQAPRARTEQQAREVGVEMS